MKRPMLAMLALALFAVMASALYVGLAGLEEPARLSAVS